MILGYFFLIFRKFRIIKKRLSIDLQQITLYISTFLKLLLPDDSDSNTI